jgi:peptidoglycan/LPS O-acetylase OafA/YrhL
MSRSSSVLRTESSAAPPTGVARAAGPRVSELDGLRGIAILLVLVFHFTPSSGPLFFLAHVFQTGWVGVDLFFVLSGYLITGILLDSVGRPHYYRNFIIRRSLRIFPLYYACLLLYGFLTFYPSLIRWVDFLHAGGAAWYLGYLGNISVFLQSAWPGAAMLTPLWSLQVEEQFYLSFPFIVSAVSRKTLTMLLLASVVAAFLLRVILTLSLPDNLVGTYVLMPCRMDDLAMGGLIAIVQRERPQWLKQRWIGWLTAVSAATFLGICLLFTVTPWSAVMRTLGFTAAGLMFTGILVMLISWRQPFLLALCRLHVLVWLGTISYGLYLLHIPALTVVRRWVTPRLGIAPDGSAQLFVSMAVAIAAAALSWWLFESRVLKLKDRFTVR